MEDEVGGEKNRWGQEVGSEGSGSLAVFRGGK